MKLSRTDLMNAFSSEEGIDKTASTLKGFIRAKIREGEITSAILPPQTPSASDMQRNKDHDHFEVLIDIENETGEAVELDFRATGRAKYVRGKRAAVGFHYYGTQRYTKHEEELYAYKYDIMAEVEKTAMLELNANIDRKFMDSIRDIAVQNADTEANFLSGAGTNITDMTMTATTFEREVFERLGQMFSLNELYLDKILMHEFRFQNIYSWSATSVGDTFASRVTEQGYEKRNILGKDFLLTIKENIKHLDGEGAVKTSAFVDRKHIYGFTSPDYLGVYLNNPNFGDTKFYLSKKEGFVSWSAKRSLGFGIINPKGCARIKLS
jgi:hypothetical protein